MILYHTSPLKIESAHSDGRFGEFLFFSRRVYYMSADPGCPVYKIEVDEDKDLIESSQLFYHEDYEKLNKIVKKVMDRFDLSQDEAENLLSEVDNLNAMSYRQEQEYEAGERAEYYEFDGEDQWDMQRYTAECAKILGYKGCVMEDEQGECVMIDISQVFNDMVFFENETAAQAA